jgi:glycosyltransferase involved in cell wall biosynthesis
MRVVLISHCNLLGNSAMHVFSMAEELKQIGHDVVMLLPDSLQSAERHRKAEWPIRLYADALEGDLPFKGGGRAEIVHAWSPREHVRKVTEALASKEGCPYIVHMEDNEEQIVNDELKEGDFETLARLAPLYQDVLISDYRSHPLRYREFIQRAAGYTCLIDRLLEFCPPSVESVMFWPGFDPEYETLPSDVRTLRRSHKINDDEAVIFYSGNVHHSIVGDVRKLYLAVAGLRALGRSVKIIRTGWDFADLALPNDPAIAACRVELGFVDRAEMPSLLAMSDILVQPGRPDSFNDYRFPSKLTEYLVSGRPVVLPNSNIGLALEDERHVLKLHDGSLAELTEKIRMLLDDRNLRARLGAESKAFALKNLRWSRAAKIASDLYETVHARYSSKGVAHKAFEQSEKPASNTLEDHPVKLVAFYLPQFHPIPENDKWWGKGFTEWTNVSRAKPQMFGHRHPRLPTELGYYDLRVADVMHEQAKLARDYGIGGFCFYVYWFEGRRLLEKPVDIWRERGPDFPYCICWANENWSRRWDGSEADVLMSQDYATGFEERFIKDMLPILTDPRYIKVQGAPVLAIYRVSEFPNPVASADAFRVAAAKFGIPDIHMVMIQSFGLRDPRPYGFDAAVEFSPPHVDRLLLSPERVGGVYPTFKGYVEDYIGVASASINAPSTDFVRYRGCFPIWDNTARRRERGHVFLNDSPKAYGQWLRFLVNEAMTRKAEVEPLVFINAWNEWAEGTYLEPDEHLGRSLLEITRAALAHGVADYMQGGASADRERAFTNFVARLPKSI